MQPQSSKLPGGELEHEIRRKPLPVAVHLLIEALYRNSVDLGQRSIKDDFLMAQNSDFGLLYGVSVCGDCKTSAVASNSQLSYARHVLLAAAGPPNLDEFF